MLTPPVAFIETTGFFFLLNLRERPRDPPLLLPHPHMKISMCYLEAFQKPILVRRFHKTIAHCP